MSSTAQKKIPPHSASLRPHRTEVRSPSDRPQILVVDDDADSAKLVAESLSFSGYSVALADCGEEALVQISRAEPSLVLLDINMPGLSGLDILSQLRALPQYVSVILVTAKSAIEDVIAGLDAGADDYIRKPFEPLELLARVRAQLRIKELKDELTAANLKLQELVEKDDLTGLFNMRNLFERLEGELARSRRFGRPVTVLMMDMDNFKNVNDRHDHLFGSHVLAGVGRIILQNIREVDFAARYGGDEFLIVISEADEAGARQFAERLRALIEAHEFSAGEHSYRTTASFGLAVASPHAVTPGHAATSAHAEQIDARSLVRAADRELYRAKASGKNCLSLTHLQPPFGDPSSESGPDERR